MIHHRYTVAIYLAGLVALVDQISKWFILAMFTRDPHPVLVTSFLNFVFVRNSGITFGLLKFDFPWLSWALIGGAAMILGFLGRWLWRTSSTLVATALGLIMGGAVGNIIDRLRYHAVVDFLDFHYNGMHWFAFNVADAAIVTGVMLLLLDTLVKGR